MKRLLSGAKQVAENVYNWLVDEAEVAYQSSQLSKDKHDLPRELDPIYYRHL
jgi:hypothetical protein